MSKRNEAYVGVSGVVSPDQQERIITSSRLSGLYDYRRQAIGIKAVHKTQYLDIPNKYGDNWYPVGEEAFSSSVKNDEVRTYNVAQMYLEPEAIMDDHQYPRKFVEKIKKRGSAILDAIQFDLLPYQENPKLWSHFINITRDQDFGVIVQAHRQAMEKGPKQAVEDLKYLSDMAPIDYVLFDASHGEGKEMDSRTLASFLEAAYASQDLEERGTNFGVAGGLD
ncbi:MAG: hypothetical protein ABJA64_01335, partial [Candidatus Saccharibacteria bacterium]